MKDDYLWDRSGEPEPEVQRLENLLGTLRYDAPVPAFPEISAEVDKVQAPVRRLFGWRPAYVALSFAALAVTFTVGWWALHARPSYEVVSLKGTPRIGTATIRGSGRLPVGQWLVTDASSSARIQVGDIGEVEVEPNTRIGLLRAGTIEHRLSLQRGVIHAFILAPPRRFFVSTPSAEAVDLGCSYTLEVDEDGSGLLRVTSGWVAFQLRGHESFVPAGAMCLTRPAVGPGTPFQSDASPALRSALERLDFGSADSEERRGALETVLREARKEDALTLWHLLAPGNDAERALVYDRLSDLVPPPKGVTREGVLGGNRQMLDLWWNELGLGATEWWRMWERPWPDQPQNDGRK
jgi:hypothetical protein